MALQPLLQIEAALIRRQAPDLLLREGQTLAARVAEREGKRGIIVLAGTPLVAELPDEVKTGDKLRLLVAETRGEKVVMKLVQDQPAHAALDAQVAIPLPGGGEARIHFDHDEEGGSGGERDSENASIALTYESPELGALGLRLALAPGAVSVVADAAAGRAYEMADDASDALQRRLAAVTGRSAEVRVVPRTDHFDAYA